MSASPDNQNPSLRGTDGELVSIRIAVEPRLLERLLDVLASLSFPINPQLYHDAGRSVEPSTIVEFPAWAGRVPEVEGALDRADFGSACLSIKAMLADMAVRCQPPLRAIA